MSSNKLVLAFFCAALSVLAQAPDAKTLLAGAGKSLLGASSFRSEMQTSVDMQGAGMSNKIKMIMKTSGSNGKLRMEMTPMGMTMVSDGESVYLWLQPLNQYMKKPAPSTPEGLADAFVPGAGNLSKDAMDAMTAKVVRQEAVDLGGQKVECYVIDSTLDKMSLPQGMPVALGISNVHQTSWIDKDRHFLLKQTSDMEMQMGGPGSAPTKIHSETTMTSLDLSPVFGPDEFKFTPPEGAKLVDSLPGMQNLKFGK